MGGGENVGDDAGQRGAGADQEAKEEEGDVLPEDEARARMGIEAEGGEEGELGAALDQVAHQDDRQADRAEHQAQRAQDAEGGEVGVGDLVVGFEALGGGLDGGGVVALLLVADVVERVAQQVGDGGEIRRRGLCEDGDVAALGGEELAPLAEDREAVS